MYDALVIGDQDEAISLFIVGDVSIVTNLFYSPIPLIVSISPTLGAGCPFD